MSNKNKFNERKFLKDNMKLKNWGQFAVIFLICCFSINKLHEYYICQQADIVMNGGASGAFEILGFKLKILSSAAKPSAVSVYWTYVTLSILFGVLWVLINIYMSKVNEMLLILVSLVIGYIICENAINSFISVGIDASSMRIRAILYLGGLCYLLAAPVGALFITRYLFLRKEMKVEKEKSKKEIFHPDLVDA